MRNDIAEVIFIKPWAVGNSRKLLWLLSVTNEKEIPQAKRRYE